MKLVITGGAGFIGGNFVNYWVDNHPADSVIVLDSLTYAGNMDRLSKALNGQKITFVNGDIQDFGLVKEVFEGVDMVVHFAAETHVDRSLAGLEAEKLFMRTNYEGTDHPSSRGPRSRRGALSPCFHRRGVRRPRLRHARKIP